MPAPIPVSLRRGRDDPEDLGGHTWTRDFSISALCIHLRFLTSHDFRTIERRVVTKLGLDLRTRVRQDNRVEFKEAVINNRVITALRNINKAMSMELIIALLLTWLDTAGRVGTGSCVKGGLPNYYSTGGLADVTAFYDDADNQPAFHIVGEVSIRRRVTATYYRKQLTQTYKHALEHSRKHAGIKVYGLVINGGKIARSAILQDVYRQCQSQHRSEEYSNIRVLPMYTRDFMNIMMQLSKANTYAFDSGTLSKVFDTLHGRLNQAIMPSERDWMVKDWIRIVNAANTPELDLDEPLEDKPIDEQKPE